MAFPKRRQLSTRRNEPRLWPFGAALAAGFATAIVGLIALTWLAWLLLHRPSPPHPGTISLHDSVSVIQLVFASVAGSGALVALIVAYRKQKIAEADSAHDRTRVFNERFATIATQLGDESPAVRLAAVHAMAGLADDWDSNRQTCIDVLCAYLRMPYEPDPGEDAPAAERLTFRSNREVRHSVIRIITAHLKDDASVSWQGRNFDFTGVTFDGGHFSGAVFSGGTVRFTGSVFSSSTVYFLGSVFSGGIVHFDDAVFSGGTVDFSGVVFSGGAIRFSGSVFSGGAIRFRAAEFSGSTVRFARAVFSGSIVDFFFATFTGGTIDFSNVLEWSCPPRFDGPVPSQVKLPAGPDPATSDG